jgi:predicted phosphodiesterase
MNRIILIGNGFDLAHGLKTQYKDFIDWFWEREITTVKNSEQWKKKQTFFDKFIEVNYKDTFDFSKLKENCTYKNGFLQTIVEAFAKNWCDIETIYFKELVKLKDNFDKTKPHEKQDVEKLNFDFDQIEGKLKEYLITETQNKNLIEIESNGKHKIKTDFEENLQNEIKKIIFNFGYPNDYKKEKFENKKDEKILLLSFNYTKTAELYKQNSNVIINNIHGELDTIEHPIIFGYGDEETNDSKQIEQLEVNEFLKKVKSVQYNKTSHYTQLENFISTMPYEVFIFGHSCANCDRTLLKMLFENEMCKSIRIFYNNADKNGFFNVYCNIYRQFEDKKKKDVKSKVECETEAIPLPNKIVIPAHIIENSLIEIKVADNLKYILIRNNAERKIKKSFFISKYQVTQKQYEMIMGNNPSYFTGEDLPVECVSWYDAIIFCNKLSKKYNLVEYYKITNIKEENNHIESANVVENVDANGFRLPTEAEWEYAATSAEQYKSNNDYSRNAKSNKIDDLGWYYKNSDNRTHPVGQKQPNDLGLYDMSGNVWEWCFDQHDKNPADRVLRGGSWGILAESCRVSNRGYDSPDYRGYFIGFRLVLPQ